MKKKKIVRAMIPGTVKILIRRRAIMTSCQPTPHGPAASVTMMSIGGCGLALGAHIPTGLLCTCGKRRMIIMPCAELCVAGFTRERERIECVKLIIVA